MNFITEEAVKQQVSIKALVGGPSGSGKTMSSLRLATGIVESMGGGDIFFIDTEGDRALHYADKFTFKHVKFPNNHTPENYISAINHCIKDGAKVIIIDSMTHEWNALNEMVNNMPGNSFQNWGKVKPRHHKMMQHIISSPIHIICTGRGKDEYVMEVNDKGRQQPKKIGLGIQQEKDTEYEFVVTFNLVRDTHVADVMKDTTGLFEGKYEVLTEEHGKALYQWANSGVESPVHVRNELLALAGELGGSADEEVRVTIEKQTGVVNPTQCNDVKKLQKAIDELNKIKKKRGNN